MAPMEAVKRPAEDRHARTTTNRRHANYRM